MMMIMIKQSHTNESLSIIVDLYEVNYQIFLVTCLKLIIKTAKHPQREKILNQNVDLLG